jgi:hypothetical protein
VSLLPLGFNATDVMQAVVAANKAAEGDWHNRPDRNGKWWWHASELSFGCTRRAVLTRAGMATDPTPLKGELTMLMGTIFHAQVERAWPYVMGATGGKVSLELAEKGFYHKQIPLASKPDALLRHSEAGLVVFEVKTEHENAAQRRQEEAREEGRYTSARHEHMLQLAAQAEVLESNGIGPIRQGAVFYMSKNNMFLDLQPVDLEESILRKEVYRIVDTLEAAWAEFEQGLAGKQILVPKRLPGATDTKPDWRCRPVRNGTGGEFCPARSTCMHRDMPA